MVSPLQLIRCGVRKSIFFGSIWSKFLFYFNYFHSFSRVVNWVGTTLCNDVTATAFSILCSVSRDGIVYFQTFITGCCGLEPVAISDPPQLFQRLLGFPFTGFGITKSNVKLVIGPG